LIIVYFSLYSFIHFSFQLFKARISSLFVGKMLSRFLPGTLQRKQRKIEDSGVTTANESQSLPTTPVANQKGLRRLDAWIGSLLRDGGFLRV
jgi:hypothetical protein